MQRPEAPGSQRSAARSLVRNRPSSRLKDRRILENVVLAGHRRLQRSERAEFQLRNVLVNQIRPVPEFRVKNLVPLDFAAAITGLASHNGCQGTVRHLLRLVQILAFDDGVDQVDMFLPLRTRSLLPIAVQFLTASRTDDTSTQVGRAIRAMHRLADRRPVALDLAAITIHAHAVRVFKLDREVIPDLARLVPQLLPSAHAPALYRMVVHDPVADIEVMHVLLADMISAKPDVVVPVANLPFKVGVAALA